MDYTDYTELAGLGCAGAAVAIFLYNGMSGWRIRFSFRTLIIAQLLIGALDALAIHRSRAAAGEPLHRMREFWAALLLYGAFMWSVIRDKTLPASRGKGTGWSRFRRTRIPQGTLRER